MFSLILISFSSISEIVPWFEGICGGIPFIDSIVDYGSLKNAFIMDPLAAATSFLDVVILSTRINSISLLPLSSGEAVGKFMVKLFTGIVIAVLSLALLNYVIKQSSAYRWIISVLGGVISLVSVGSIPFLIISTFNSNLNSGLGMIGLLILFSKSKVVGILRDSFLKAIVFVIGIWLLERFFGSIANGVSQLSVILIAFAPVIVCIIGVFFILKSAFFK